MKTKIIVGYSTNKDSDSIKKFNKEIKSSIGCAHEIVPFENKGTISLNDVYNTIWKNALEQDPNPDTLIFVFIHHDIHFKNRGWGKYILNTFNNNNIDIMGIAGTSILYQHCVWWLDQNCEWNQNDLWGKVWHTNGKEEWKTDFTRPNKKIDNLQSVAAIDGVFIAFNPLTCEYFDSALVGFHFYDISFCLKNVNKKIVVTEKIQICHESGGAVNQQWEINRRLVSYKNIDILPVIK